MNTYAQQLAHIYKRISEAITRQEVKALLREAEHLQITYPHFNGYKPDAIQHALLHRLDHEES